MTLRETPPQQLAVRAAVLHLLVTVLGGVGVFILLIQLPSGPISLAIAALSGAASCSITPLLGRSAIFGRTFLGPLMYAAVGVGAASAAFILSVALLIGDTLPAVGIGSAAYGGIVGVAAGYLVKSFAVASNSAGSSRLGANLFDVFGRLDAQLQDSLTRRAMVNYDGEMVVGWYPSPARWDESSGTYAGRSVVGRIRVALMPSSDKARSRAEYEKALRAFDNDKTSPADVARAAVGISSGISAEKAPFVLQVHAAALSVLPTRVDILAGQKATKPVEFLVFASAEGADDTRAERASDEARPTGPPPLSVDSFLVELLQHGTTIQVLEFGMPVGVPRAGESG